MLAGFTLALQDTRLIAMIGIITGAAASLSMASSEYLSAKEDGRAKPLTASMYTGAMYLGTVIILIMPFLVLEQVFIALGLSLTLGVGLIFVFNYYVSVIKNVAFKQKFMSMTGISLSVAAISFLIGMIVRAVFGIEI
ncbi:hypothetical protein ACFL2D_03090 [Patescibacteria group bacterium]